MKEIPYFKFYKIFIMIYIYLLKCLFMFENNHTLFPQNPVILLFFNS